MSMSFPSEWLLLDAKLPTGLQNKRLEGSLERMRTDLSIDIIRNVIIERLSDPTMNAETTATLLGLSLRQLQRYLNTHHTSFRQVVSETRAQQARKLLQQNQKLSVGDVALACGYSSSQSLSRAFRTHFGETPSQLSQMNSEN